MVQPYIEKLVSACDRSAGLSAADHALLLGLRDDIRHIDARRDIVREGEVLDHVPLMIAGWACRHTVLRDGSRQITAILLPGDFCGPVVSLFDRMDHGIAALTDCQVAAIPRKTMGELLQRPHLAHALQWAALVDEAVLRAWIVNLGRRDAFDRVGHLLCELHARLGQVGLTDAEAFELPLTQEELADALGLTPVHINRTLRRLREEGLISLRHRRLVMLDVVRLRRLVGFSPTYLHLPRQGAKTDSRQPLAPRRPEAAAAVRGA